MSQMKGVPVDMRADGLLWMINRTVFHPHGYALGTTVDREFVLYGDGEEPWVFATDDDAPDETDLLARFHDAQRRSREFVTSEWTALNQAMTDLKGSNPK